MPLFNNKFTPKKTPERKANISELGRDIDSINDKELIDNEGNTIKLSLGEHTAVFENGQWGSASGTGEAMNKNYQKLKKQVQVLREENNLLKLKFDILLDMLTQTTAENHIQQREIDKIKKKFEST